MLASRRPAPGAIGTWRFIAGLAYLALHQLVFAAEAPTNEPPAKTELSQGPDWLRPSTNVTTRLHRPARTDRRPGSPCSTNALPDAGPRRSRRGLAEIRAPTSRPERSPRCAVAGFSLRFLQNAHNRDWHWPPAASHHRLHTADRHQRPGASRPDGIDSRSCSIRRRRQSYRDLAERLDSWRSLALGSSPTRRRRARQHCSCLCAEPHAPLADYMGTTVSYSAMPSPQTDRAPGGGDLELPP